MFDEKTIEAYRKTTAPVELKERVMKTYQTGNARHNNVRLYKTLSTMAACLILIFSAAAFTSRSDGNVSISMNGSQIAGQPMTVTSVQGEVTGGIALASVGRRAQPKVCIPLEVEVSKKSVITVSDGEMQIFEPDTGELIFTGTEYTTEKTVSVEWYLPDNQEHFLEKEPYMSIIAGKKEYVVQLAFEEMDNVWTIYQRQEK